MLSLAVLERLSNDSTSMSFVQNQNSPRLVMNSNSSKFWKLAVPSQVIPIIPHVKRSNISEVWITRPIQISTPSESEFRSLQLVSMAIQNSSSAFGIGQGSDTCSIGTISWAMRCHPKKCFPSSASAWKAGESAIKDSTNSHPCSRWGDKSLWSLGIAWAAEREKFS